jgi:hypothetical protein
LTYLNNQVSVEQQTLQGDGVSKQIRMFVQNMVIWRMGYLNGFCISQANSVAVYGT